MKDWERFLKKMEYNENVTGKETIPEKALNNEKKICNLRTIADSVLEIEENTS